MTPRNNLSVQIAMRIKEVESTNQHYMYDTVCQSLVTDFIHSNSHMTLVAYGPYNNGKSYTLIGDENSIDTESSKGILPRLVYDLMNRLVILTLKTGVHYLYYVSFIEIYNDIVIDLLNTGMEAPTSFVLDIDELGYTHIHGVSKVECAGYEDVLRSLKLGLSRRNTKHLDGHVSSLSHVVFTLHVYTMQAGCLTKYNKLIFIDLTSNESENLIEESIHGYNEYYNSSYQIIYDVIANKYQFMVPNYFTAIHKYLQDAFNTNIVRPLKHKNQIDFVSNHMKTVVLCCISNDPLYARDVHNCVSLLSYIYNLYSQSGGSPVNASEQISKEVFINYLRNKQMGQGMVKEGQIEVGEIPGRVIGGPGGNALKNGENGFGMNEGVSPVANHLGGTRSGVNGNSSMLSNLNNCDNNANNRSELTETLGMSVQNQQALQNQQSLQNQHAQRQQFQSYGQTQGMGFDMSSHTLGNQVLNDLNSNLRHVNLAHHINGFDPNDTNGHNRNTSQHIVDNLNNQFNNLLGNQTNFHPRTPTNNSYPSGSNGYNAPNHNQIIGPNCNQMMPNFNQCVPNFNQILPNFNPVGASMNNSSSNPLSAFTTPFHAMPDNQGRNKQPAPNSNGSNPSERKTSAIETRKRSTCRPSLCKIDEEADNLEESEGESEKEEKSGSSDKDASEENTSSENGEESDAYNSSEASNSLSEETNEVIEEDGNESLDDINEDLRSDDEAICTDSEGNNIVKGLIQNANEDITVRNKSNRDVAGGNTNPVLCVNSDENVVEAHAADKRTDGHKYAIDVVDGADCPSFAADSCYSNDALGNVCKSREHDPSHCRFKIDREDKLDSVDTDKLDRHDKVDTENDTSGVFSANLMSHGVTDEITDELKTDDEVGSEMSEDEELLDDTKSIPTSDVGSDEEIALLRQEEEEMRRTERTVDGVRNQMERNENVGRQSREVFVERHVESNERQQDIQRNTGVNRQTLEILAEPQTETHSNVRQDMNVDNTRQTHHANFTEPNPNFSNRLECRTQLEPSSRPLTGAFVKLPTPNMGKNITQSERVLKDNHKALEHQYQMPNNKTVEEHYQMPNYKGVQLLYQMPTSERVLQDVQQLRREEDDDTKESSDLNRTTETEDSEEETDEDEEEHVNELMVKTELEKIYTELEEKIETLNAKYLKEVYKTEKGRDEVKDFDRSGNGGLFNQTYSGHSQTHQRHCQTRQEPVTPQQVNFAPPTPANIGYNQLGYPCGTQVTNFGSVMHSNAHNLLGAYVNENLVVQRRTSDSQTPSGNSHMYTQVDRNPSGNSNIYSQTYNQNPCGNSNMYGQVCTANPAAQDVQDPSQITRREASFHEVSHHRNYHTAFGTINPLPSSHAMYSKLSSPTALSNESQLQKSASPRQMITAGSPVNASVSVHRTVVNNGQAFTGGMNCVAPDARMNGLHFPDATSQNCGGSDARMNGQLYTDGVSQTCDARMTNHALVQGQNQTDFNRNHPFQNHPNAFQTSNHPMSFMNNQPMGGQLQSAIPMVTLGGYNFPAMQREHETCTRFSSIDNQYSPQDTQYSQQNVQSSQAKTLPSAVDFTSQTSRDSEQKCKSLSNSENEKLSTRDNHASKDSSAKSRKTSESDVGTANSKESRKGRKRKSSKGRHKRESTQSSGERTNESGSQKGKKKHGKTGKRNSQKMDGEDVNGNGGTIENELIQKIVELKVDEPFQIENGHGTNGMIPNGPSHMENMDNLAGNIASFKLDDNAPNAAIPLTETTHPNFVPAAKTKSHKVSKKAHTESQLDNVLSSCEFQHVWNDIDTKKSQMNVILLDLDTASERINELKQLINLKNHLLKFLVNNKPLRDEVRNKLDAKTVQLKMKLKKCKHDLYELKHMEEKMNLEKLNLKFKKNRNGNDANKQLILFNHLNRIKHDDEPGKSSKRVHRHKHRDIDRHKHVNETEDGVFHRNSRALINKQTVGTEPSLGALVSKYSEGRLSEFNSTPVYESDDDPLLSDDNTLPASIANMKAQIEVTESKLHNLEVIMKITMQSDEQIEELNKNLSKWTKILTTFEKLIESEKVKKEQLKNDLVLNLYKIKSMEETFGHDRHKEEVLRDINVLIEKLKPSNLRVEGIKTERDVTESDKTIKPDSNDSGSNATISKNSDAKVELERNEKRKNSAISNARKSSEVQTRNESEKENIVKSDASERVSNPTNPQINVIPSEPVLNVPSNSSRETSNKSTNTETGCNALDGKSGSNRAETSSQTDNEVRENPTTIEGVRNGCSGNAGVQTSPSKRNIDQKAIDEYNKEVLQLAKQANKKSNVIDTLMNGSDKKLDNLLETESSIDTLGSTSMRNYKINNSTEISDNALSVAAISDKSAGVMPIANGGEKRKKKSSLSRAFSFRKSHNAANSTGSGACPSTERSAEKPSEKPTTGKKIKNFILNKSGDKNKSNDSIRFKKPDDQMSNCSNQSSQLKSSNQNVTKEDDKLSNSSLASKLRIIVENNSTRDGKPGDEKKPNSDVGGNASEPSRTAHQSAPCCARNNPHINSAQNNSCQCTEQSSNKMLSDSKPRDAPNTAFDERKAKRNALKTEIEKLLELKQVIVDKRMKLFPSKCPEQSDASRKLFFEYDESIETIDVLIEFKGTLIRELDSENTGYSVDVLSNGMVDFRNGQSKDLRNGLPANGILRTGTHEANFGQLETMNGSDKQTNDFSSAKTNAHLYSNSSNICSTSQFVSNESMNFGGPAALSNVTDPRRLNAPTTDSGLKCFNAIQPGANVNSVPNDARSPVGSNNGIGCSGFVTSPTTCDVTNFDPITATPYGDSVPIQTAPTNELYASLVHKLISLNTNELVHIVFTYFHRIVDLRSTTVEFEKLVQNLDFKLEMKITNLQEMNLKFERLLQNNQISNEKHLTLLQKDYQNKLHLFYKCYCSDHVGEDRSGGERPQSASPTAPRAEISETLLLREENKFLKSRVKFLESQLRKKETEKGGYELVPSGGQQVGRVNQLGANLASNKTITMENKKLVISRKK